MSNHQPQYHSRNQQLCQGVNRNQSRRQNQIQNRNVENYVSLSSNSIFQAVFVELTELISSRELYKQPRLSVKDISDLTGLSIKDISFAFSEGGGMNFNRFVNLKRIEDVQKSLAVTAKRRSVLEIAFASGFNSKSSFNSVFRKEVGETPSQFAKRCLSQKLHAN